MTDANLTLALESRLLNAWPSFDYQVHDGWMLRLAKGYSKRANSVTPFAPGLSLDEELLDHMIAQFHAAGVMPTFRLPGIEAASVDALLQVRGFQEVEPTLALQASLAGDVEADPDVLIETQATTRWARETAHSYGADKADDATLFEIISRIRQKAAFVTLHRDGKAVAWGLGVVERGYVGLYDIVVSPQMRGAGLGRRIVTSLMAWGRVAGAHSAYLQVREENAIARKLYERLGFKPAYRYRHRVLPRA
ncbi:GNAT family N-acetyltransferase [Microvirga flavescens]|uniref:GNAT family N-acetyltransferase n=1 Tax=Microvirga flavescens TaxID=2249811 RepID=UPI000DDB1026|nr:GNAT family N-acetyltransferase [Microvirga flavescens]